MECFTKGLKFSGFVSEGFLGMSRLVLCMVFAISCSLFAQKNAGFVGGKTFAQGYDPVSYLLENKAQKGQADLVYSYKDTRFHFVSRANLEAFKTNPEKHLPAYNGWCAYAMAKKGKLVSVNPKKFIVVNGRVFLFYSNIFARTLVRWKNEKSEKSLIEAGDRNWLKYSEL